MPSTITPNMSLTLPGVGTQAGPQYASDVNNSLSVVDAHNHTTNNGVAIPTAGINIDGDLPFNTFGASDLQRLSLDTQITPLSGVTYPTSLYASGVDLYYNDGSGNQIQITSSGQVNTATGNITGLVAPATASYLSGPQKFLWQANSGTSLPASMDAGSVIIREQVAAGFGITVAAPAGLASGYTLTLPAAAPLTTNALLLTNTSGVTSFLSKGAANTVLRMDSGGSNLEYSAVDTDNITDEAVTQPKLEPKAAQPTSGSGGFATSSTVAVDVSGTAITTSFTGNRPIRAFLSNSGTGVSGVSVNIAPISPVFVNEAVFADLYILQDGVGVYNTRFGGNITTVGTNPGFMIFPNSSFQTMIPAPSPGAHTYKVQVRVVSASPSPGTRTYNVFVSECVLVVYEE